MCVCVCVGGDERVERAQGGGGSQPEQVQGGCGARAMQGVGPCGLVYVCRARGTGGLRSWWAGVQMANESPSGPVGCRSNLARHVSRV